jgi:hypothetical protein
VDPKATVRLERVGILKKSISSGFDPATFRLVAQCLNRVPKCSYRVPKKKLRNVSPAILSENTYIRFYSVTKTVHEYNIFNNSWGECDPLGIATHSLRNHGVKVSRI